MGKDENRFEIDLPPGWEDQTVYHFRGPVVDDREHMLMMIVDRKLQTKEIGEFALRRTGLIAVSLQGIEVLKDEETTVAGCYPSWEFVYRWIPAEGVKIFKKYIFVLHGSRGYSFEIEFSKMSYKLLGEQVKKLVEELLPGTYEAKED